MKWEQLANYKTEKIVEDEIHVIKIVHTDLQRFCICVTIQGALPKTKRKYHNLLEVTYTKKSDAIDLYHSLLRGDIYMDNII